MFVALPSRSNIFATLSLFLSFFFSGSPSPFSPSISPIPLSNNLSSLVIPRFFQILLHCQPTKRADHLILTACCCWPTFGTRKSTLFDKSPNTGFCPFYAQCFIRFTLL